MKSKAKISDFFTREKANQGVKMVLLFPDGTPSEESLQLLGIDSDAFRKASVAKAKETSRILSLPEEERHAAYEVANAVLLASLIISWTLDTPFNQENVVKLLLESRTVYEQVDSLAGDRARFFARQ